MGRGAPGTRGQAGQDPGRAHGAEPVPTAPPPEETCDAWYERYFAYQRELGKSSARDARYCWTAWLSPRIGARQMKTITRRDVEDIRDALDAAVLAWRKEGRGPGGLAAKGS
jgi:hypothetical protein